MLGEQKLHAIREETSSSDNPADNLTDDSHNSDSSDNLTDNLEDKMESSKKIVKIDPRMDIRISEIKISSPHKTRPLNPAELKRELRSLNEEPAIYKFHPELKEHEENLYKKDDQFEVDYTQAPFLKTELMEHQFYGISWMKSRELSESRGGILADEMGLGKTLQMIGLILRGKVGMLNLVVVPSIALPQWITEMNKHAPGAFNIISQCGRTKITNEISLDESRFNVILTTYGTVENSYRRKNSILHTLAFTRVVLDEAHVIKDNRSSTSKAIITLNSEFRWALTGTPVQNRVGDLLSLIKFLKINPQAYYFCKKCNCKSLHWLHSEELNSLTNQRANNVTGEKAKSGVCDCGHFAAPGGIVELLTQLET